MSLAPLVVVDLESLTMPEFAKVMIESTHRDTCPERPLHVVAPDEPWQEAAGIIITGSDRMLHEDTPWAADLSQRIEAAAKAGVPVLGICFGHQLLCWHFGGKVARLDDERFGVAPVHLMGDGPFAGIDEAHLFHVYKDHVTDAGRLTVIASGGLGGIQATRHPELPIWTIQGHPETRAEFAEALPPEKKETIPPGLDMSLMDTPDGKRILRQFGAMLV